MSKRKILIWSVVAGILINVFIISKLTYNDFCFLDDKPGFDLFNSSRYEILGADYPGLGAPLCPSLGWPIQTQLGNNVSLTSLLSSIINVIFSGGIIWSLLTLINRIKRKSQIQNAKF